MRTLLLDSHSLLFRAFHALPPMSTTQGEPTQALYGFSVLLLKLLREEHPCEVALARDLPGKTLRHERYPDYKAGRAPAPWPLVRQLELFEALVAALGFPMFALAGYEADDVLATLATREAARERQVVIVSGDRDLLQLVDARCSVLFVGQRGKPHIRYDRAAVQARFGIAPERLPGYVALIGDSADNIPKLKGIGDAKASALMQKSATLAALLDGLDALVPDARLRALLASHEAQLRQSEQLVTLHRDLPLPTTAPRPLDAEARARTAELFETWEFRSLIPRLNALAIE